MYKKISYFIATMFGGRILSVCFRNGGVAGDDSVCFCRGLLRRNGWGFDDDGDCLFIGTAATHEVLKYTKHDPSIVVIDETAGQLLTFALVADRLSGVADWRAYILYAAGFCSVSPV